MNKFFLCALIIISTLVVSYSAAGIESSDTKGSNEFTIKNEIKAVEKQEDEKLLYQGKFHNADKRGSGTASVYKTKDGKRILRLTNFKTTSGPDLFVYVYKAKDAKTTSDLKNVEYISLGRLKNRRGDQEYEIPVGVDLESFQALSIWCKEFGVNFATASLAKA